ncbi:capsule assembly Wzi family protein [Motilimonas eburnea]|uniref:capsule assembly Wzi family protein n=1 Tax=Motilimonas eburnea TaxID=1737488 RepID=UPI001E61A1A9|nr:capsule assembly Wzi family protein [Motilimonas eburnea]MCE2572630.1 capsule assembly Wzi family protein [Motilimonas eburnea]
MKRDWQYLVPLFGLLASAGVSAASPFISLQDDYLNGRIEQLSVVTNMPTLAKPYSVKLVRQHLEQVKQSHPALFRVIDTRLQRYEQDYSFTYAEVAAGGANKPDGGKVIPNARGEKIDSNFRVAATGVWNPSEYAAVSVGGLAYDGETAIPVDSYVVIGWDSFQVDIGYREHWFSPFQESAMLLSTNARPSVSIGFSNPVAFESLWNLKYDVFFSRLEHTDGMRWNGEDISGRPGLLGFHMSVEPISGWTIGVNRTQQLVDNGDLTVKEILKSFWDPTKDQNGNSIDNQIASVTSRINFQGETPFSIYAEYGGEDTVNFSKTRLGNLAVSAGLFIPFMPQAFLGPNFSFTYEYTEFMHAWYVHHVFKNGYTNDGVAMGSWAGDNRYFGDPVGARVHVAKLGWQAGAEQRYELTYRNQDNQYDGGGYKHDYKMAHELDLKYYGKLAGQSWGYRIYGGTTVLDDDFIRGELNWHW